MAGIVGHPHNGDSKRQTYPSRRQVTRTLLAAKSS